MPCSARRAVRATHAWERTPSVASRWGLFLAALLMVSPIASVAHDSPDGRISELTHQIAHAPHDASLLLKRGELLRLAEHYEDALGDFRRAARLGDPAGEADFQLGWTLQLVDRPIEARPHLDRYIATHPDDSKALAIRARTLVALDDNLAAAADFTAAIALSPVPDYYLERARALAAAGDVAGAVEGLDRGLERIGAVVSLQRLAIDLELARNNIDGAVARVDSMAGITGRADIWLARRGDILLQAGRRDEAHAAYGRALAAIEALPARHRNSSTVRDLKTQLEAALQQPAGTEPPTPLPGTGVSATRTQ